MNNESGHLVPLDDFLAHHGAFFESQGYRVTKSTLVMEFTRLSDGRSRKMPALFNFVAGDITRELFLADLVNLLLEASPEQQEANPLILLDDFLAQHSAFFESQGYRLTKSNLIFEFTRLSDGKTMRIPAIFNMVAEAQAPEEFLADVITSFDEAD